MIRSRLFAAVVLLAAAFAQAEPAQVIIIRHGEKPDDGDGLSAQGRRRAAALVPYFLETPEVRQFGSPAAVYAQKSTDKRRSTRPVDTVAPLAEKLGLTIAKYSHSDFATMVKDIRADPKCDGKMVLICWEHKAIPDLVKEFGVADPKEWKGKAFDRTWIITFAKGGPPTLKDLPQRLLFGDSNE